MNVETTRYVWKMTDQTIEQVKWLIYSLRGFILPLDGGVHSKRFCDKDRGF